VTIGLTRIQRLAAIFRAPAGQEVLSAHRLAARVVADPAGRLLTDVGYIDVHARERAVFGDPWLFRMLVETGRIDPKTLIDRIDSGYYETVVTSRDFRRPDYASNAFGLPMVLVERLRARYEFVGVDGGLFVFAKKGPRRPATGSP
jgi:hypothetical protein